MNEWQEYISRLSREDQERLLKVSIARLMEIEEVSYRPPPTDEDEGESEECLYWDGCGESLIEDEL